MAASVRSENIHATAVLIGDRGILVTGPSGSGKTSLALALIAHFGQSGYFSRLVGDDQLFVETRAGRLVCRAPATIAGLVEVRGIGPRPVLFEPSCVIDLHVRLLPDADVARFQEDASDTIAGCKVPRIDAPARNALAALHVVAAWLGAAPFL